MSSDSCVAPPAFVYEATIGSTANFNLKNFAIAAGWTNPSVIRLEARVTIAPGAVVYSLNPAIPAFDTGSSFPPGSSVAIINNGTIAGTGGNGGSYSLYAAFGIEGYSVQSNGGAGGTGLVVQTPVTLTNNGTIGGGGGGGYSADNHYFQHYYAAAGGGGGGGAPFGAGGGSFGGVTTAHGGNGSAGAATAGGAPGPGTANADTGAAVSGAGGYGGGVGAAGAGGSGYVACGSMGCQGASLGGAPGNAVQGNGFVTWSPAGSIVGAIY